jgi:sec-independent protein translocase protein TatA
VNLKQARARKRGAAWSFRRMGSLSIWHWLIVLVIVALVFGGRGKLSGLMGDAGKGIKAFREGLKDDGSPHEASAKPLPSEAEKDKAQS